MDEEIELVKKAFNINNTDGKYTFFMMKVEIAENLY